MEEEYRNNDLFVVSTYILILLNYVLLVLYFIAFLDSVFYLPLLTIVYFLYILYNHLQIAAFFRFGHQKAFEPFYYTPKWMECFSWMLWCPIILIESRKLLEWIRSRRRLWEKLFWIDVLIKVGIVVMFAILTAMESETAIEWTLYAFMLAHLVILGGYKIDFFSSIWISYCVLVVFIILIFVNIFLALFWETCDFRPRKYHEENGRWVEDASKLTDL